ncbi:helix-turn-helix domain-containing protein [Mucilaginibacter ginkgonis]|uniref:Helix-turn-helix domain-containing protein n=1 Tax=Mucilaginibacter ginkgonis TaxID=2682091 RepID=A0A6I4I3B6_9SPHI|nr:helix-turn-helix domain-containing protein [Mucilaginibacter ginkgonis]QQL50767.1 helix-turn-helix domain-containing protein [Mucilaginibacter ginkgonis]
MHELSSKEIIKAIRLKRMQLGYSQEYMAAKLDVSQNAYSKIELGYTKVVLDRVLSIFKLLNMSAIDALSMTSKTFVDFSKLFHKSATPMWIFEPVTLKFLEVNDAAVERYGYNRDEFLNMTIRDIRPKSELENMSAYLTAHDGDQIFDVKFKHLLADGSILTVDIVRYAIVYKGEPAFLVTSTIDSTSVKDKKEKLYSK